MNRSTGTKRSHHRMRIGDVAARAGVNPQTLRYYERRGMLAEPKRSTSGYREYPRETVRLIRFIKRAQELGFTLDEIEELITLRQTTPRRRAKVRELAAAKMRDIDEKLARLQAMRSALYTLVEDCACGAETLTCPILEALDDAQVGATDDADR
jgi:Hg(II)-responsive transcriptional regulator